MRKFRLLVSCLALGAALTATAQTLVEDASAELVEGTLISLQCRDTNGGGGYYFNGGSAKSATFAKENLYVVKGNATDGLKLCRLSDGKYVGQASAAANALVTDVETAEDALTFTAKSYGTGNFTFSSGNTVMEGSVDALYVRFSLSDGRFLNTNTTADTPKLFGGTGGFSAWYVYKYDAADLDVLKVDYTFEELDKAGVPAVCRVGSKQTTTAVPEGKFLVRGAGGRPGWLYAGGLEVTRPYLWNNGGATPTTGKYIWTAEKVEGSETGEFYLKSSYAGYISRSDVKVFTENTEDAMKFRLADKPEAEAGVFNLQTESSYLNMDGTGEDTNHDAEGNFIITQWNEVGDPNGKWEIYPCNIPATFFDITYVIVDGETERLRTTVNVMEGAEYPQIPSGELPAFVVPDYPEGTVSASGEHVLTYTTNLPFEPSTSFEDAKWYAMDVHSNMANYVVYYEDGSVKVKNNGNDTAYQNGSADENEQWCFVGNVWDGFNIYNYTAGSEVSLYQSSDADVEITMSEEGQAFRVYEGAITNSAAFKLADRRYYFNHRETKLQGWTAADQGSSFRFFPVLTEEEQFAALLADVEAKLATIDAAFAELGREYPVQAEGVDAANVIWPGEYKFNGLESNFDLLTQARKAVADEDAEALATAKANLSTFISLSNSHGYPRTLIYTVSTENCGTAYMPFNTSLPAELALYECTGVADDGYTLTLTAASTKGFSANMAYIVDILDASAKGRSYQFIGYGNQQKDTQGNASTLLRGVHTDTPAPADSYVLQNRSGAFGFYHVSEAETVTVPAGTCYLVLPEGAENVECLLFPQNVLTGIAAAASAATTSAATYDLSGRQVSKATRGLYIVGGQKVLVK